MEQGTCDFGILYIGNNKELKLLLKGSLLNKTGNEWSWNIRQEK